MVAVISVIFHSSNAQMYKTSFWLFLSRICIILPTFIPVNVTAATNVIILVLKASWEMHHSGAVYAATPGVLNSVASPHVGLPCDVTLTSLHVAVPVLSTWRPIDLGFKRKTKAMDYIEMVQSISSYHFDPVEVHFLVSYDAWTSLGYIAPMWLELVLLHRVALNKTLCTIPALYFLETPGDPVWAQQNQISKYLYLINWK